MENIETSGSALATGSIAARFISQDALNEASNRREQEWKDAYARIGQEPPPQMTEQPNDGRTLYERLKEQEILKQEEWDNKMKLSNQYRGLMTDELNFLADKVQEKRAKEQTVEDQDNMEVADYKEAQAKRQAAALAASEPKPAAGSSTATAASTTGPSTSMPPKRIPPKSGKKDIKSLMKGVVVKKKAKPPSATSGKKEGEGKGVKRNAEEETEDGEKKRKL